LFVGLDPQGFRPTYEIVFMTVFSCVRSAMNSAGTKNSIRKPMIARGESLALMLPPLTVVVFEPEDVVHG
jgi:hypothetical protein